LSRDAKAGVPAGGSFLVGPLPRRSEDAPHPASGQISPSGPREEHCISRQIRDYGDDGTKECRGWLFQMQPSPCPARQANSEVDCGQAPCSIDSQPASNRSGSQCAEASKKRHRSR